MSDSKNFDFDYCKEAGRHFYFVAETGTVEDEGKVIIILVCTACGDPLKHEFTVTGTYKKEK